MMPDRAPANFGRQLRQPWVVAVLVWAVISAIYLVLDPPSTDSANQRFRARLFEQIGFRPWNNQWFNGHHTPAYSLLAPPISAVLGGPLTGVLAALLTALLFDRVIHHLIAAGVPLMRRRWAAGVIAATAAAPMMIGQAAYAIGVVFGLLAIMAVFRQHGIVAVFAAVLCAGSSPAAGLFVALVASGMFAAGLYRRATGSVVVSATATFVVVAVLFPEGGNYFPYSFAGALNLAALLAAVAWSARAYRSVLWVVAGYVVLLIATLIGTTGMGNIVARFAGLAAAPVVVLTSRHRRSIVVALCLGMVAYQWSPVTGIAFTDVGPVRTADDYALVLATIDSFVASSGNRVARVEIVPLRTHDESVFVADKYPIARGWHRHLDRRDNMLFYEGTLTASEYQQWLIARGISIVAIADVPLDYGGVRERELLDDPPPYLRLLAADSVWRVYEVIPNPTLVTGPVVMTALTPDTFTLEFAEQGTAFVKIQFSPWFDVEGPACVAEDDDGWTVVQANGPGIVTVTAQLSWRGVVHRRGTC